MGLQKWDPRPKWASESLPPPKAPAKGTACWGTLTHVHQKANASVPPPLIPVPSGVAFTVPIPCHGVGSPNPPLHRPTPLTTQISLQSQLNLLDFSVTIYRPKQQIKKSSVNIYVLLSLSLSVLTPLKIYYKSKSVYVCLFCYAFILVFTQFSIIEISDFLC